MSCYNFVAGFLLTLFVCVLPRLAEHMPAAADQNNCLFKLQSRALPSCCSPETCCQTAVKSAAVKLQPTALVLAASKSAGVSCSQERSCCLPPRALMFSAVCRRVGGGFGGKASRPMLVAAACAVAAHKLGKQVRLSYNRNTDFRQNGGAR